MPTIRIDDDNEQIKTDKTVRSSPAVCDECGATLEHGVSCREYLDKMITWDFEDFAGAGQVHHLTVLSYNLQHPKVYSQKGLEDAADSLREFLEHPQSFKEHDDRNRERLASSVRDWKITGTSENHGEYASKPAWKIRASDVVREGRSNYVEHVRRWAQSILESIADSSKS